MPHSGGTCYEFDNFRLDPGRRILSRAGEEITLAPKLTETLILLVTRAGELVEKDELINQVWPDSFVEESNLNQNIFTLRRVLGEQRGSVKFIETVTRRGYRFIAPVRVIECEPEENDNAEKQPPKLAILPLLNAAKDPSAEYLVEGLTDNIINNLSSVSKVRVMARSAVARYKDREVNPKQTGRDLGVDAVLLGKIHTRSTGLVISVELVDTSNGWQLWGESFDCAQQDVLEIQNRILMQLSQTLRLKLTGDEEKRITARYTESGEAYQSYLEGRYHWSQFTRTEIETAISYFRRAIEVDSNYALAYAGIIDCYLRLATNYLPPDSGTDVESKIEREPSARDAIDSRVKLRHEWDWKGAERELRRASELKAEYPSATQWYAAYLFARKLFQESKFYEQQVESSSDERCEVMSKAVRRPSQIASINLTKGEQAQIFCTIAREQLLVGNFEAADLILRTLRSDNGWPQLRDLPPQSAGDLLFTMGLLTGNLAGSGRFKRRHRHAEALLNGAVAVFEMLSLNNQSAEAHIELGRCYYREGLFGLASESLATALQLVEENEHELRASCLVVLGAIDRETGNLMGSMTRLTEASVLCLPRTLTAFRCNFELAATFKGLGLVEGKNRQFQLAIKHFYEALRDSNAIGNHLYEAYVRNSLGFLLITIGNSADAERHLVEARRLFEALHDEVRNAGVGDTLARLYVAQKDYRKAWNCITSAVQVLELNDSEAVLAEALTTKGWIAAKLNQPKEAIKILEGARKVAERCGDEEEIARILLILYEDLHEHLGEGDRRKVLTTMKGLAGRNTDSASFNKIRQVIRYDLETS